MTEVRRQCFALAEDNGFTRSAGIEACNCMIGKARWWHWTHPGGDYTRAIHLKLGEECFAAATANASAQSSGAGVFHIDPDENSASAPPSETVIRAGTPDTEADDESETNSDSQEAGASVQPKTYSDTNSGTE